MALKVELIHIPVPETAGIQDVRVVDINGNSRRVAMIPADDGAALQFKRIPNSAEQRDEILAEVTRIRKEMGLATDARSSQPPDPAEVRAALKKDKKA